MTSILVHKIIFLLGRIFVKQLVYGPTKYWKFSFSELLDDANRFQCLGLADISFFFQLVYEFLHWTSGNLEDAHFGMVKFIPRIVYGKRIFFYIRRWQLKHGIC